MRIRVHRYSALVKEEPHDDAEVAGYLPEGEVILSESKIGRWYKVRGGYISDHEVIPHPPFSEYRSSRITERSRCRVTINTH